ncbi:lasso peptide biosynthesis B2 protein [Alteribacter natronophilus]|uniref:lasso peptide biosynthesis B2 protein n=1 Tax=Alteribacter natronophilus TaxID=2583810 RepID=UPI00110D3FFC|nr:lasso peptide biosynthesis B2 protein [Alteribacter natronophilus]TMW70530.1 lasso peptide biosynthesis B2 protein [Alteribacter natronophilus]
MGKAAVLIRKLRAFWNLPLPSKKRYAEAYVCLALGRWQKGRPFSRLSPTLGKYMEESPGEVEATQVKSVKEVSVAVHAMTSYTFWESQCMVKALAAKRMLERRGIDSTLYMGTAKDPDGKLAAHAWLRSGPFIVTGKEGKERFTVVAMYAQKTSTKGESHEERVCN